MPEDEQERWKYLGFRYARGLISAGAFPLDLFQPKGIFALFNLYVQSVKVLHVTAIEYLHRSPLIYFFFLIQSGSRETYSICKRKNGTRVIYGESFSVPHHRYGCSTARRTGTASGYDLHVQATSTPRALLSGRTQTNGFRPRLQHSDMRGSPRMRHRFLFYF